MRRSLVATLALSVGLATSLPLRAQPSASNKAAAEALFQEGSDLFGRGEIGQACERFGASQDLDPGLGTMLRLADCLDRLGKTASAWALFREAASIAGKRGDVERETIGNQRADNLEERLSRLSLSSAEATMPPGMSIELNGSAIPVTSLGVPLPVDPGTLKVEVVAEGRKPWSGSVEIPEGPAATTFEIPVLERVPPKPKPAAPPPPARPAPPSPVESSSLGTVGFVTAGVGLLGLAAGGVFAYRAMQLQEDSLDACQKDNPNLCSQKGYDQRKDSLTAADAATLSFGIGGALLLGGVVLVIVSPSGSSEPGAESQTAKLELSASPSAEGGTLRLGGTF
jgi:hypothetical protein